MQWLTSFSDINTLRINLIPPRIRYMFIMLVQKLHWVHHAVRVITFGQ